MSFVIDFPDFFKEKIFFFFQAQDNLMHELRSHRFFDVFEYNGPMKHWGCFLCNHPDRATYFVEVRYHFCIFFFQIANSLIEKW